MAHRKVNVDDFGGDEDAFLEPDADAGSPSQTVEVLESVGRERVEAAKHFLSRGKMKEK